MHSQDERERIRLLCQSKESVSSKYAEDPSQSIEAIGSKLYGSHHLATVVTRAPGQRGTNKPEDLEWARSCGNFGDTKPSELFLHAYHDLLQCLHRDPLANCVSPSLCGSTGLVPMTIIAPLNDQLRHMYV